MKQTSERDGVAAELATQRNHLKYSNVKSRGLHLVVVRVETMGVCCEVREEADGKNRLK